MRSVCAPVMAAMWSLAVSSTRRALTADQSPWAAWAAQRRVNSDSARMITLQCSCDRRSRTLEAVSLSARRL